MDIEIRTDNNIDGNASMIEDLKAGTLSSLSRFDKYVTSLHVYFADVSAGSSGPEDIQCTIEARLEGRQPEAVTEKAETVEKAHSGAISKIRRMLDAEIEKMRGNR